MDVSSLVDLRENACHGPKDAFHFATMTPKLTYASQEEFEPDYKQAIYAEVAELVAERVWWNQPLQFEESASEPDLLTGGSRIMHRYVTDASGASRSIAYRDDVLMGMVDYLAIVEMLTMLSKEHEFAWDLSIPSEPRDKLIGTIDNGEIDPRIFDFLVPELQALEIDESELQDEALRKTIRSRYFGTA